VSIRVHSWLINNRLAAELRTLAREIWEKH
jgi:hypothetical protein